MLKPKSPILKKTQMFFSISSFQAFCAEVYHTQKRISVINDNVNDNDSVMSVTSLIQLFLSMKKLIIC